MEYRGYEIKPKQDFSPTGYFIKGEYVKSGFNVVKDGVNVMPGAIWFQTTIEAKEAIDALTLAQDNTDLFWLIMGLDGTETFGDAKTGRVSHSESPIQVVYTKKAEKAAVVIPTIGGQITAVKALALAAVIRRAALNALGDETESVS